MLTSPLRRYVAECLRLFPFALLEAFLPHSCVHVFSSTFDHHDGQERYDPSDFMKYRRVGFHVHLDCRNLVYHVLLFCVVGVWLCELFPAVL